MKKKHIFSAFLSEGKLTFYDYGRWLTALLIFLVFIGGFFFLNQYYVEKKKISNEVLLARYAEQKEEALEFLDKAEGKIPITTPLPTDSLPKYIKYLNEQIALYDFYLETGTTENDYYQLGDEKGGNYVFIDEHRGAAVAFNVIFIYGIGFIIISILLGFAAGDSLIGKKAKLNFTCELNRKEIFFGKNAFYRSILFFLALIIALSGIILIAGGQVKNGFYMVNSDINIVSLYGVFLSQFLYIYVLGGFFYAISLSITMLFNKISVVGLFISVGVFFGGLGLCNLSNLLFSVSGEFAMRAVPVMGLLYNIRGFADFTVYYNLPLTIISTAPILIAALKRFEKFQI